MAERTVDILIRLNTKPADAKKLLDDFTKLEDKAKKLQTTIDRVGEGKNAEKLKVKLAGVKQEMAGIDAQAKKLSLEKSLAAAAQRAGKLKQQLENLGRIGNTLAIGSAAILTPLVIAVNKYKDSLGETEPTSKRLVELSKRWEESQIRLGRVVAEQILPHLEKALDYVDKAVKFAEENPGFIEAALTIVGAIGILGTIMSGISIVGNALLAIQGVATFLGIGGAATGAAATGTAVAGGAAATGLTAAGIAEAIGLVLASPFFLVPLTAFLGAELGLAIVNGITGGNYTLTDVFTVLGDTLIVAAEGWDIITGFFGISTNFSGALADAFNRSDLNIQKYVTTSAKSVITDLGVTIKNAASAIWTNISNSVSSMASKIWEGIVNLGNSIVSSITGLFSAIPGMATGGELSSPGIFMGAEKGREFVMTNSTTRAAENIIGGKLTQAKLLQALAGGRNVSYHDARRFDASVSAADRRMIRNDTMMTLSEALG